MFPLLHYVSLLLLKFQINSFCYRHAVLFCFVFKQQKEKKKSESAMQPVAWMFSSFLSSLPQALYKPKRLFSSRAGSTEGGKGHLSQLSMYLIVYHLSVYFPHPISSHGAPPPAAGSMTFTTLFSLPLLPTSTILFCFLNFSQTVVAIRLSLQLYRVRKIFVEITKRKTEVSQYNDP